MFEGVKAEAEAKAKRSTGSSQDQTFGLDASRP